MARSLALRFLVGGLSAKAYFLTATRDIPCFRAMARDGHLEFPAVSEVNLGFAARRMLLGEVHLPLRTVQRPPIL